MKWLEGNGGVAVAVGEHGKVRAERLQKVTVKRSHRALLNVKLPPSTT